QSASSESSHNQQSSHNESHTGDWDVSSDETQSDQSAANSENNFEYHYTRTYVGNDDVIEVDNSNSAALTNEATVDADTGGNESAGDRGGRGEDGGDTSTTGSGNQDGAATGGAGGNGGRGGNG